MGFERERGTSLVEAAVAIAIVAMLAGAILGVTVMATHAAGGDPVRSALQDATEREMRLALDVVKYRGATIAPRSVATTLPSATGSPLPATLSIASVVRADGGVSVSVSAVAAGESNARATVTETLNERAPLPGASLDAPGLAPAPTGAP